MKRGGVGGASTLTGQAFEAESDLLAFLKGVDGYKLDARRGIVGAKIFFESKLVARSFKKHKLYEFLDEKNVDWKRRIPANCFRMMPFSSVRNSL